MISLSREIEELTFNKFILASGISFAKHSAVDHIP